MSKTEKEVPTLPGGTAWPHDFAFTVLPDLPECAPRRGGRVGRWIGRMAMRLLGWRVTGCYPAVPKLVVIEGPHTSYWDGVIALATIMSLDLDIRIMAKHTAFVGPVKWILNYVHAIPIDRTVQGGATRQMIEHMKRAEKFNLGVAPEGTRKKVDKWKTGFYRIAEGAGVPIMVVALDFGVKQVRVGPTIIPSGDIEADLAVMKSFYATATGKNPENA
jgi:1-acyl-sn-glycerol-3-phosphate acyltransferase